MDNAFPFVNFQYFVALILSERIYCAIYYSSCDVTFAKKMQVQLRNLLNFPWAIKFFMKDHVFFTDAFHVTYLFKPFYAVEQTKVC